MQGEKKPVGKSVLARIVLVRAARPVRDMVERGECDAQEGRSADSAPSNPRRDASTPAYVFTLKPVGGRCNLGCTYCYYRQQHDTSARHTPTWPIEFVQKVMSDLAGLERSRGRTKVRLTWHGGEPLLAGLSWYEQVFRYQQSLSIDFENRFQTNGTLLTTDWVRFLKANGAKLGFSLDGPEWIHDRQRIGEGGEGTFKMVMKALDLCREQGLHLAVLCVVTQGSSRHACEVLDFFYKNQVRDVRFHPALPLSQASTLEGIGVSPAQYAEFMKAAFDWYMRKDDPDMRVPTIDSLLERLLGGEGNDCTVGGTRCGSFPVVEADGSIAFCDDYGAGAFPSLGNMGSVSMTEAVHSDVYARCRRKTAARLEKNRQCADCAVRKLCGGGCPRDWRGEANRLCEYHRIFYGYVSERVRTLFADVLE
jgi:uncharacterized protein